MSSLKLRFETNHDLDDEDPFKDLEELLDTSSSFPSNLNRNDSQKTANTSRSNRPQSALHHKPARLSLLSNQTERGKEDQLNKLSNLDTLSEVSEDQSVEVWKDDDDEISGQLSDDTNVDMDKHESIVNNNHVLSSDFESEESDSKLPVQKFDAKEDTSKSQRSVSSSSSEDILPVTLIPSPEEILIEEKEEPSNVKERKNLHEMLEIKHQIDIDIRNEKVLDKSETNNNNNVKFEFVKPMDKVTADDISNKNTNTKQPTTTTIDNFSQHRLEDNLSQTKTEIINEIKLNFSSLSSDISNLVEIVTTKTDHFLSKLIDDKESKKMESMNDAHEEILDSKNYEKLIDFYDQKLAKINDVIDRIELQYNSESKYDFISRRVDYLKESTQNYLAVSGNRSTNLGYILESEIQLKLNSEIFKSKSSYLLREIDKNMKLLNQSIE